MEGESINTDQDFSRKNNIKIHIHACMLHLRCNIDRSVMNLAFKIDHGGIGCVTVLDPMETFGIQQVNKVPGIVHHSGDGRPRNERAT